MARAKQLRALATFACEIDGEEHLVHAGQVLPANHPAVKGREELFGPEPPVEDTTAAPGEKRRR